MTTENQQTSPDPASSLDPDWQTRARYWQRKLGRIQLGAEPVEEQLAKYRRVTWMLTGVPLGLSLMFVALFAAFRRPDVGLVVSGILFLPIVLLAWIDYGLLSRRVARYSRELDEHRARKATPGRT
jgi:hypothetical protein